MSRAALQEALAALRADLIHEDGPRISTMRNYRFAIVPYEPSQEFELRREVQRLSHDLVAHGWVVLSISLLDLLVQRIHRLAPEHRAEIIEMERMFSAYELDRSLLYLKDELASLIEGEDGLAADVARIIQQHCLLRPDQVDRTLVLIGRAGALYPFFRTSALLRYVANRTNNVPVVLLYPGERKGQTGLSFMGVLPPDSDYRPRIYP